MSDNILSVKGIKKSFGGVHALKGVDLSIRRGEIHCLAGENGCGKSTIIKVISGFYKPDAGSIEVDGKIYENMTPADALAAGIQVIYQDFSVFPNLTVMENLAINKVLADKKKFVSRPMLRRIAKEVMSKIDFQVDLDALVETLPVADKQLIAISRALMDNAKLIIMDEPTTALTKNEIDSLFAIVRRLREEGVTILFVSHKLDEVFGISDSITVLRSGENVISCPVTEMTDEKFAYYMTGRHFDTASKRVMDESKFGDVIMEADHLTAPGFEDVSFRLHKGEILGIAGQLGSGRTELSLTLFGMNSPTAGTLKVDGKIVNLNSVSKAIDLGIALVPEDRLTEGLFLPQPIMDNMTVLKLDDLTNALQMVNDEKKAALSQKWVDEMGVATKDHTLAVQTLSGGNQQKVVLGKWLARAPRILILNGPTVGVDIGAKYDIHSLMQNLADTGMAIIVVSDDTAEVVATCDRALIMQGGRVTEELRGEDLDKDSLSKAILDERGSKP